jgi:hypothetical protein
MVYKIIATHHNLAILSSKHSIQKTAWASTVLQDNELDLLPYA